MGFWILGIWVCCAIYVQNRGQVKYEKLSRRISGHASIFAPVNCLFYLFSRVRNTAYIDLAEFPEFKVLSDNWEIIRDEALSLNRGRDIKASEHLDDLGFNSFFKTGWKRFYLKWYGSSLDSAKSLCPRTVELLDSIPTVRGGMFAMLPPGARLATHSDPYAGSLRYHLGLVTPNSDQCYINVDGTAYSWRDGEAVMFDETYIHYAENATDKNRIVLFLDVKRPVNFFLVDWFDVLFSRLVMAATATKNREGDKVGAINRMFWLFYQFRTLGKWVKRRNKPLYYLIQYALYAWLIYLILL